MHVLLLNLQWPPDVNSTGVLMSQLTTALVAKGHRVTVHTTFPHYTDFRVGPPWRGRWHEVERAPRLTIHRWWVYASGRKGRMGDRLLSYLSYNVIAALAGLGRRDRPDVIFATNGSFFTGLTARWLGAFHHRPYVLNVQDIYPDAPLAAGQLRSGLRVRLLAAFERAMYARARRVTVVAPGFRDNLVAKGVAPSRIEVVPNFVDTSFIRTLGKDNPWSRAQGLHDKFVVAHAGNLGFNYDLETLLDAAHLMRSARDVVFVIVGEGVARAQLQSRASGLGLDNVRFLPFQPRDQLPHMRAAFDVQVSLYKPGMGAHSMPSKLYEIMASGRPVLASADPGSDVARLVESTGAGLFVASDDPAALAEAVERLHEDPSFRARCGDAGRRAAETLFSLPTVAAKYEALLAAAASEG